MGGMTNQCSWWRRWYHRRLRRIDRKIMLPMLIEKAMTKRPGELSQTWDLFTAQPEQAHWRCACANTDFLSQVLRLSKEHHDE